MNLRRHIPAVLACLAMLAGGGTTVPLHAAHQDQEEELVPRIEHENNPIKKAKLEIRLARLKLLSAITSCKSDDHPACKNSLGSYLDLVKNSWKDLKSAGKNPVKHPSGFRELDIALREDVRIIEDSKRDLPFEDRATYDPVLKEVNTTHDEVFAALFPSAASHPPKKGPEAPQFVSGGIE